MNVKMNRETETSETLYCGRRPKNENIEPSVPLSSEEEEEADEREEDENLDDEVNFDKPTFNGHQNQIWNDYAEDLDYDS